jgi:hypothetical protein
VPPAPLQFEVVQVEQPKQPVTVQLPMLHPVKLQLEVECVLQLEEKLQLPEKLQLEKLQPEKLQLLLKLHENEELHPEVLQLVW